METKHFVTFYAHGKPTPFVVTREIVAWDYSLALDMARVVARSYRQPFFACRFHTWHTDIAPRAGTELKRSDLFYFPAGTV
jgi:hypothetical protein